MFLLHIWLSILIFLGVQLPEWSKLRNLKGIKPHRWWRDDWKKNIRLKMIRIGNRIMWKSVNLRGQEGITQKRRMGDKQH